MTDDLDPELKELFAAEEDEAPPEETKKRLAGILGSTLALPVPPLLTAAPLVAKTATVMVSAAKAWTMAGAAFVAGGAAVIVWTSARSPAPVVVPTAPVAPTVTVSAPPRLAPSTHMEIPPPEPPLDAGAADAAADEDASAVQTSRPSPVPSARVATAGISAEGALLDDARTAVNAKDYATALRILDHHAHQFPHGQLWEEREALAIDALVQARDLPQAQQRADRLRERSPHSLFLPLVDAALRSIP